MSECEWRLRNRRVTPETPKKTSETPKKKVFVTNELSELKKKLKI